MKTLYTQYFIVATALISSTCAAQEGQPLQCGHDRATQQLYAKFPGLEVEAAADHARMLEEGKRNLEDHRNATPPTYIVPVVFHIIHNYGTENISDAQVMDAVDILNEDFRKLNADTSQIVAPFDTLATDAEIEFRLAQLDPNGNCTNGIDRIASMETYVGDDGSKLNQWPRDKYLNIWVVKYMEYGVSGYAYFPSAVASPQQAHLDGIVILSDYVGSIGTSQVSIKHTISHNVGHWLELSHLGAQPLCIDGDGISDTPITMGWVQCQLTNNDVCNAGIPENVQNFMEFSYCPRMFTPGQKVRMHNILNGAMCGRNNLWTNANLIATGVANPAPCAPVADFNVNRQMICEGGSMTFTDLSWNGTTTSWEWTLTGPTTLTSLSQNPVFTNMTFTGWYDVTLIASNAIGADTITKTNYLLVSPDTATVNGLYIEDFTTPNIVPYWYITHDNYGNGSVFTQLDSIGHSDQGCVWLNEFGNCLQGDVDELITPSYYLSYNTNLQIRFYYSYAEHDPARSSGQGLRLYSSIDCGQTWSLRWNRIDTVLPTVPFSSVAFFPGSTADWDTITVNMPSPIAASNVRFKFAFTSPQDSGANNLFIDNINILSTNVGMNEFENKSAFTIYPNPGDGNSTIAYSLEQAAEVQYSIYDVSGRLISSVDQGQQAAGSYSVQLKEHLSPGTYFIEMRVGAEVSVQRFVVDL